MHAPMARPHSHRSTCWQPGFHNCQFAQLALALAACPGPHHYMCVCKQPLSLHRNLQLAPRLTYPWLQPPSLYALVPSHLTWKHGWRTNNLSSCRTFPTLLTKDHIMTDIIIQLFKSLRQYSLPQNPQSPHACIFGVLTTRPRVTSCANMPHHTSEGLFLLKSVHSLEEVTSSSNVQTPLQG